MGWVSPTSHDDPDGQWDNEADAYDGSTESFANTIVNQWQHWVRLILPSNIICDKIRLNASQWTGTENEDVTVRIQVYNVIASAWLLVDDCVFNSHTWTEKLIPPTAKWISQARVWWSEKTGVSAFASMRLWEFEFNEIASRPLVGGSLAAGKKGLV